MAQVDALFWGEAEFYNRPDRHFLLPLLAERGGRVLRVAAFQFGIDLADPTEPQPTLEGLADHRLFHVSKDGRDREVDWLKKAVDYHFATRSRR